jgi:hypothetical protein
VLLPFVNRAFNIDEPLFIWAAQQIQKHPGDPYGFPVNWYGTAMWMSDVMKNPPLASYFIAAVGSVFGMSEVALHVAFMVPAMALVVGTYRLALRLTDRPMLAAVLAVAFAGHADLCDQRDVRCDDAGAVGVGGALVDAGIAGESIARCCCWRGRWRD